MVKPIDNIKILEPIRDVRLVNGNEAMAECEAIIDIVRQFDSDGEFSLESK